MSKLQLMYVSVDHEKAKRHAESGNEHTRQQKAWTSFLTDHIFRIIALPVKMQLRVEYCLLLVPKEANNS